MEIPQGKLIAIGGSVDKGTELSPVSSPPKDKLIFFNGGILKRILTEMKGVASRVEVITTASRIPDEIGKGYSEAFAKLGCTNIGLIHIKTREDALQEEYIERIKNADGVMFTGGNQMRLSTVLGGTEFMNVLLQRYMNENFLIAGTSAGAMAMSNTMIYEGNAAKALLKGEVKITTGLAFIKDVIIDSHFVTHGRFGRLAQVVSANPACIGIGLGEDTGVIITEGNKLETIGSGTVILFDGHGIKHSNIVDIDNGSPISIENLIIHVLAKGNFYFLKEQKFFAELPVLS